MVTLIVCFLLDLNYEMPRTCSIVCQVEIATLDQREMFCLSEIEHTLRLPPHLLNLPLAEAIKGELEGLFLDKVRFRLLMFRPFLGEVISARLKESSSTGLRLSLGFFDDIYIPRALLPSPSHDEPDPEDKNQVRWIWEFNEQNYPIDGMDEIRFRVHSIQYPSLPLEQDDGSKPFAPMLITVRKPFNLDFSITDFMLGSLDADGLGPIAWWV
ncbi:DNA-directed RNA polymerase III subunit rpc8-like isoform X3 [Coffea arabica]|uniref:DNA-directed RNA polymerase subunit n=1 Tax=Coffea arabica TaxID=13443 RepID=A0ABM4X4P2_COFAR